MQNESDPRLTQSQRNFFASHIVERIKALNQIVAQIFRTEEVIFSVRKNNFVHHIPLWDKTMPSVVPSEQSILSQVRGISTPVTHLSLSNETLRFMDSPAVLTNSASHSLTIIQPREKSALPMYLMICGEKELKVAGYEELLLDTLKFCKDILIDVNKTDGKSPKYSYLREFQANHLRLMEAQKIARIGSWEWNLITNDVQFTPEVFNLFNVDAQAMSGFPTDEWMEIILPEDRSKILKAFEESLTTGIPFRQEYRIKTPDKKIRWICGRGDVIIDDSGKPVRIFGTVQDITGKKLDELELKATNDELREELNRSFQVNSRLLSSQLNPHFIFNALNSIQFFVLDNDTTSALDFISKFSSLMRGVLNNSEHLFIPLEDEIKFLETFLELEKQRLNRSFESKFITENIDPEEIMIPPMLLQPIIENSIIHGIAPLRDRRGKIEITFTQKKETLEVTIEDNGIGRSAKNDEDRQYRSMSTDITTRRLNFLNDLGKGKFQREIIDMGIDSSSDTSSGTKVEVRIPLLTDSN